MFTFMCFVSHIEYNSPLTVANLNIFKQLLIYLSSISSAYFFSNTAQETK